MGDGMMQVYDFEFSLGMEERERSHQAEAPCGRVYPEIRARAVPPSKCGCRKGVLVSSGIKCKWRWNGI